VALLQATTLARLKTALGISDSTDDARLTIIIDAVSREIEAYLDSALLQETQTEEHDVGQGQTVWYLRSRIAAVTSIKTATDWDWASATALDSDFYHFTAGETSIQVKHGLRVGRRTAQFVYTGGFATSTTNLVASFEPIALAADYQCVQEWRRKENLGSTSRSAAGSSKSWTGEHSLLERSQELLDQYRRLVT